MLINTQKVNKMLLNDEKVIEKAKSKNFPSINDNENTKHQNLCDTTKTIL